MGQIYVNNKALAKAKELLKRRKDAQICVKAGICPSCGQELKYKVVVNRTSWSSFYKCAVCEIKLTESGERIE